MIKIEDKSKCCGCEACVQVCPKRCISFDEDVEGFRYPKVDTDVCIGCGRCDRACPVINTSAPNPPLHFFAARNTDEEVRASSSSGGVFALLAEKTVKEGGVVFGAAFGDRWEVVHSYSETLEGISAFRSSKYVQSRIGTSFRDARDFLGQGRKVLFSGTSCQIAALKLFLGREYENLLTVDVICHGVPSPKVWRMYLEEVKKSPVRAKNTVSSHPIHSVAEGDALNSASDSVGIEGISFRDKRTGWKKYSFVLTLAKASAAGKKNSVSFSHIHRENPYMLCFLSNVNLRPSCFDCPAKGGRSRSDITLADFWGIDRQRPEFDDDRGVGLVILNTDRGEQYYKGIDVCDLEVSREAALAKNRAYYRPARRHPNREAFFKKLAKGNQSIIDLMIGSVRLPFWFTIVRRVRRFFGYR